MPILIQSGRFSAAPVAMDMYISGEGTHAAAVTTTTLGNCTFSSDAGAWALPDNAGATGLIHSTNGALGNLRSPIRVNGVDYSGSIATGFQLTPSTYTTDRARRTITGQPEVLVGFFFRANVGAADFNVLDFINLEANGGANWAVAQWKNYSPPIMRGHSAAGTVDLASGTGTDNQIYWVQVKYSDSGNLCSTAVWTVSGSTYTLVDAQTITMTTTQNCTRIFVGLEAHGVTSSDVYNWCNMVVKWTSPGAYNTLML